MLNSVIMKSSMIWSMLLVSTVIITMTAAQPPQCLENINCEPGSYCEGYYCYACLDCKTYNRERPKDAPDLCIKSVRDCGSCIEGFVENSDTYSRCGTSSGGIPNWVIITVVTGVLVFVFVLLCAAAVVCVRRTNLVPKMRTWVRSYCVVNDIPFPSAPPAPMPEPKPELPPSYKDAVEVPIPTPYNHMPQGGVMPDQWTMTNGNLPNGVNGGCPPPYPLHRARPPTTSGDVLRPSDESETPLVRTHKGAGGPGNARRARATGHTAVPYNRPTYYRDQSFNEEDDTNSDGDFIHNDETTPSPWTPHADNNGFTESRVPVPGEEVVDVDGEGDGRSGGEFSLFAAALSGQPLSSSSTARAAAAPHPQHPAHAALSPSAAPEAGGDSGAGPGAGGAAGSSSGAAPSARLHQNGINIMLHFTNVNQHVG